MTQPVWIISLLIPREWKLARVLSHEDFISIQIFLVSVILSWVLFKSVSLPNSSPNYLKFFSSVTALECALLLLQILAALDWVPPAHPSIGLGKSALFKASATAEKPATHRGATSNLMVSHCECRSAQALPCAELSESWLQVT